MLVHTLRPNLLPSLLALLAAALGLRAGMAAPAVALLPVMASATATPPVPSLPSGSVARATFAFG